MTSNHVFNLPKRELLLRPNNDHPKGCTGKIANATDATGLDVTLKF